MKPAAGRLLLMVLLFGGWLAYLGYLVYTRPKTSGGQPLVLSRPQFLVSTLDVVARVEARDKPVTVLEVLYPPNDPPVQKGDEIIVTNLGGPQPPPWTGPGDYLLPLQPAGSDDKKRYQVAPIPSSPGYRGGEVRIYPANPQTLAEYREMPKPR